MYVRSRRPMGDSGQFSTETRIGKTLKSVKPTQLVLAPPAPRGPITPAPPSSIPKNLLMSGRPTRLTIQQPSRGFIHGGGFMLPGSGSSPPPPVPPSEAAAQTAEAAASSTSTTTHTTSSAPMLPYAGGAVALPKAATSAPSTDFSSTVFPGGEDLFMVPDDAPSSSAFSNAKKPIPVKYIAIGGAVVLAGLYFLTRKKTRR